MDDPNPRITWVELRIQVSHDPATQMHPRDWDWAALTNISKDDIEVVGVTG